ncbi:uncharacterized protein B0J16DRAFT_122115 [Fusarium flagelliforme]|uniref:uncharacterized protein n=1 Tax=Fusarium flagelliforme TaxID=2675880 RepID=UPI001E8DAAF1|nr:uncharacterized protein B0J16DRAFT_122115 [Fusarium flagelliforme]KAH7184757.1 hypothetical protein B0J16DRAFT_122115 [Fusarium flagelliforme]
MVAKKFVAAVFAAYVAAGPCKPKSLPSDIFSSTASIDPTTPVDTTTSGQTTQSEGASSTELTTLEALTTTAFEQSTQTTEAASTTTSVGPAGEAIILQINPQQRRAKRDTTFIGTDNPTSCDLATTFRINDEQLQQDGVPVYYEGEAYQELATQDTPPADAVTRGFSIDGGYLSWTNDAFGDARFCQTPSDGKVYIIFTLKPTGCQGVTLTAYKQSQCQNGQIIGEEVSSGESTSVEVTSSVDGTSSAEITTSAEQTTSAEAVSIDTSSTETTGEEITSAETTPSEATTSNGVTSESVEGTSLTEAPTTTQEATSSETTSQSAGITSSANVCFAGLSDPNGQPDVDSRISDCSAYNTVTVSPFASTTTVLKKRVYYQIPTAWATPQPKITKRADDPTDTTIFPTEIPSYATYCDSPEEYFEACSETGVTAFTTTLDEPETSTTTSTSDGCAPLSLGKRGLEYLGYTVSEDWDRAIFTGVVLHERFHD